MKAQWYTYSGPNLALRRTLTVVWVPDAGLQFHWIRPNGAVQIIATGNLLPAPDIFGELVPDGERHLPYPLVKAARRYLDRQEHLQAQKVVLQSAMDRITGAETRNEFHLQEAAGQFLRDRPV